MVALDAVYESARNHHRLVDEAGRLLVGKIYRRHDGVRFKITHAHASANGIHAYGAQLKKDGTTTKRVLSLYNVQFERLEA